MADARQTAGSEVERARRETRALETARRAAEEEASRLPRRVGEDRAGLAIGDGTRRRRGGGGGVFSAAARAAEGMLRTQSEKATKLEKLAEELRRGEIRVAGAAGYAEWRLAKLKLGSDGVEEEELANEFANLERRVKISDVLEKQRTTATSRGIEMGSPSTDEDDFLDDLASSKKRLARTAFETSPARAVLAGIKKRVEALRAEEEGAGQRTRGRSGGKIASPLDPRASRGEDLADTL